MKILIAEDEYIESEALKKLLNRYYPEQIEEIRCCGDGQEAVRLVREERPDVVFMDIEMPLLNGIAACQRIREFDKKVSIIMLTAYGTFDYARESIRNGVVDYIMKPYGPKTIRQVMDKLVMELQQSRIAERAAMRLNEMLGHEYLLRLIANQNLAAEELEEYRQILELDGSCYLILTVPGEGWGREKQAFEELAGRLQVKCMAGEYSHDTFAVCYGQEGQLVKLKQEAAVEKAQFGQVESDWNRLGQLLRERIRMEDGAQRALYEAVLNRDIPGARAACRNLVEALGRQSQEFDMALVNLFHELVCDISGEDSGKVSQLETVLDMHFFVPYHMEMERAKEEFCSNVEKLIRYQMQCMEQKNHRMIEQARAYIEDHYARDLSLEDIAASAAVSKYYLSRMFKLVTGENLKDYLLSVRIREAKKLLLSGSTVTEAAYSCGFHDPAYFSKCFKKLENCSPGSFRG